jgi:hypothetical protein
VYVVEARYGQQLLQKTVPDFVILSPVSAKILTTGFHAPFDLLTGYGTGGSGIAHLAGKIAVVAKIHMNVNGMSGSDSRNIKMSAARALLKTWIKRLSEDHTLLIALDTTTVASY